MSEAKPLALIIEDDEDAAEITRMAMMEGGFAVEVIMEGLTAQERLKHDPVPRIVVLDLHLPGISGRELLRQIRSDDRLKDIQVIIVSADHLLGDMLREPMEGVAQTEATADIVLIKPVKYADLRELSRRLVSTA